MGRHSGPRTGTSISRRAALSDPSRRRSSQTSRPITMRSAQIAVILTLLVDSAGHAQTGASFTIKAEAGRPLAKALQQLQANLLVPIDYEEAPFENPSDLRTAAVLASGATAAPAFALSLDMSTITPYRAVQSVYESYHNAGLPGAYKVVQKNDWISVIPSRIAGTTGLARDVTAVMSRRLTFPTSLRNGRDTLRLIVDGVSNATESKVILLNQPFWEDDRISIGANGDQAGDVIHAIGAVINRPISYQCLYDTRSHTYYLNVEIVAPPPIAGSAVPAPRRGPPTTGPTNSPWFRHLIRARRL